MTLRDVAPAPAGHAIVFVHIGDGLPPWIASAIRQARHFNACPIYVIAERSAISAWLAPAALDVTLIAIEDLPASPKRADFHRLSRMEGGFWSHATERFFVLEDAARHLGLGSFVHLENDVLIYIDLAHLMPRLQSAYSALATTFNNDDCCIPGVVFVRDVAALARATDHVLGLFADFRRAELPRTSWRQVNDMALLANLRIRHPDAIDHLPVIPVDYPAPLRSSRGDIAADASCYAKNFDALGMVFDGAALGQFLGGCLGVDEHEIFPGYLNPTCLYDATVLRVGMRKAADGLRRPYVETGSGQHLVANLHVHSKQLWRFLSK